MGDKAVLSPVATSEVATPAGTPKKTMAVKTKQQRAKPTHPKASEMVIAAITALKERGGSSLQAIKKYVAVTYKVDAEKQATFIKKYLKAAVASGVLVQTKGKGAAGSFKLPSNKVAPTKPKAKAATKSAALKKVTKKPAAKKPISAAAKKVTAKAVIEKKKSSKGPAAKPPKAKTTKAKPAAKSPAKKAKPVAPKKTKPAAPKTKKAAPKKASAAKK